MHLQVIFYVSNLYLSVIDMQWHEILAHFIDVATFLFHSGLCWASRYILKGLLDVWEALKGLLDVWEEYCLPLVSTHLFTQLFSALFWAPRR